MSIGRGSDVHLYHGIGVGGDLISGVDLGLGLGIAMYVGNDSDGIKIYLLVSILVSIYIFFSYCLGIFS